MRSAAVFMLPCAWSTVALNAVASGVVSVGASVLGGCCCECLSCDFCGAGSFAPNAVAEDAVLLMRAVAVYT